MLMFCIVFYILWMPKLNKSNHYRGGGGGRGYNLKFLKEIDQNIFSYKNDAKFIILKNSRLRSLIICLILCSFISVHEHRFVKLIFIDRYTVMERCILDL